MKSGSKLPNSKVFLFHIPQSAIANPQFSSPRLPCLPFLPYSLESTACSTPATASAPGHPLRQGCHSHGLPPPRKGWKLALFGFL